jgi:hypothetical protein
VFDEDGARTTTDAIEVNHRTEARGAMTDGTPDPDWLQSFIVFAGPLVTDVTITGVIDDLDPLKLDDGTCLTFVDFPLIYRVGEENGVINEGELMVGDLADATGSFDSGCLLTETLIVETP